MAEVAHAELLTFTSVTSPAALRVNWRVIPPDLGVKVVGTGGQQVNPLAPAQAYGQAAVVQFEASDNA